METYTIVVENVQHVGMLAGETIRIGNVLFGPVPITLVDDLGSTGTAAVVRVEGDSTKEAKDLAASSLENAITVLTYAFCRQAIVEGQGGPFGNLNLAMGIELETDEHDRVRIWRKGLERATGDSSDEGAGRALVIQSGRRRCLPRLVGGSLQKFVSDPSTRMLERILFQQSDFSVDEVQAKYARSMASAATCLRRSMESDPPHDLIDAFTGLEALFTPRNVDPFYPIGATIGYGVAYTCPGRGDSSVRLTTWKDVKDLFGKRSTLVHGDRLSDGVPNGASEVEKMLVESLEFSLLHAETIVACGGTTAWLHMAQFGCPAALCSQGGLPS